MTPTQVPIDLLYDAYLRYVEKEKGRTNDHLHPSLAGRCFKIHQFLQNNTTPKEKHARVMRLLRLGTIVGDDIEAGITKVWNNPELLKEIGVPITLSGSLYTQLEVEIKRMNIKGTLDIVRIHGNKAEIVDNKTSASYKFKKIFGRVKEKSNLMYEKQITTYAIAIMEKFPEIEEVELFLNYYNKDNSDMRQVYVNNHLSETILYWERLIDCIKDELIAGEDYGVPFQSWECSYCDFAHLCKSPFKRGGKK